MGEDRIELAQGEYGTFQGAADDEVVFGTYRREGTWSRALVELLADTLLDRGGTLLDVGANIGLCTVPVVERSRARALCFEPEPLCHRLLQANVARHGLADRVLCFELALADGPGRGQLAIDAANRGDNRLLRSAVAAPFTAEPASSDAAPVRTVSTSTVEVTLARLDDVLASHTLVPPVVMKVDAQGAEVAILRGAERTLASVEHLILEYWPHGIVRHGDRVEELEALVTSFARGAVLRQDGVRPQHVPITELFQSLAWIPRDGSDHGFFDVWLTR